MPRWPRLEGVVTNFQGSVRKIVFLGHPTLSAFSPFDGSIVLTTVYRLLATVLQCCRGLGGGSCASRETALSPRLINSGLHSREGKGCVMGFRAIRTAGLLSFFSAWLTMIFWSIIAPDMGIKTIGYPMAMLVAIAVWLVIALLAAATMRSGSKWHC